MKDTIRSIVSKIREFFPQLSLENVIDDLEASVEELGINVLYSDMKDLEKDGKTVSGFARVSPETGRPEIVINGNEPYYRQRFTIAHELGHIFLHWRWLPGKPLDSTLAEISFRSERGYSPVERKREVQANEFAAELLVPLEDVENYIESLKGFGTDNIRKSIITNTLSNVYKVSGPMAAIQLSKIRYE